MELAFLAPGWRQALLPAARCALIALLPPLLLLLLAWVSALGCPDEAAAGAGAPA